MDSEFILKQRIDYYRCVSEIRDWFVHNDFASV